MRRSAAEYAELCDEPSDDPWLKRFCASRSSDDARPAARPAQPSLVQSQERGVSSEWSLLVTRDVDGVAENWNASNYQRGIQFIDLLPHAVFLRSSYSEVLVHVAATDNLVHLDGVSCHLISSDSEFELVSLAGPFNEVTLSIDLMRSELRRDGMYILRCRCDVHPRYWGLTVFHVSSEPDYSYPRHEPSHERPAHTSAGIQEADVMQGGTRCLLASIMGVSTAEIVDGWGVALSGLEPISIGRASAVFLDLTTAPFKQARGTVAILRNGVVVMELALNSSSLGPSPLTGPMPISELDGFHEEAEYEPNLERLGTGTRKRIAAELLARDLATVAATVTRQAALEMSRSDAAQVVDDTIRKAARQDAGSQPKLRVAFVSPFYLMLKNRPQWLSRLLQEHGGGFPGADGSIVMPHQWFSELYYSKAFLHPESAENVVIPPLLFMLVVLKADVVLFSKDNEFSADPYLTGIYNGTYDAHCLFPLLEMKYEMPRTIQQPRDVVEGILGKYNVVISHLLIPLPPMPGQIRLLWPENYWVCSSSSPTLKDRHCTSARNDRALGIRPVSSATDGVRRSLLRQLCTHTHTGRPRQMALMARGARQVPNMESYDRLFPSLRRCTGRSAVQGWARNRLPSRAGMATARSFCHTAAFLRASRLERNSRRRRCGYTTM